MVLNDQSVTQSVGEMLELAAARLGMTPIEMADLLESELNTDHLLAYVTAVMSNRMN